MAFRTVQLHLVGGVYQTKDLFVDDLHSYNWTPKPYFLDDVLAAQTLLYQKFLRKDKPMAETKKDENAPHVVKKSNFHPVSLGTLNGGLGKTMAKRRFWNTQEHKAHVQKVCEQFNKPPRTPRGKRRKAT
jgi:hypothetical protein